MRLTADLILRSPSVLNPLKERELDLRGNKIAAIENLGATQDQFDCIDLSDNEISKVENFPILNRLRTLLLNNNRITRIAPNLGESLPELQSLILANNKLSNLSDIVPLADLPSLKKLSLLENPITTKQHYRLYVIHKLPKLTLLDFRKVKPKERQAAEKLFGPVSATNAVSTKPNGQQQSSKTDDKHVQSIAAAIKNASSLAEVEQLSTNLASGQVPMEQ